MQNKEILQKESDLIGLLVKDFHKALNEGDYIRLRVLSEGIQISANKLKQDVSTNREDWINSLEGNNND